MSNTWCLAKNMFQFLTKMSFFFFFTTSIHTSSDTRKYKRGRKKKCHPDDARQSNHDFFEGAADAADLSLSDAASALLRAMA